MIDGAGNEPNAKVPLEQLSPDERAEYRNAIDVWFDRAFKKYWDERTALDRLDGGSPPFEPDPDEIPL